MFTNEQINEFKQRAVALRLSGAALLFDTDNDIILAACNGIGPSGFPQGITNTLNRLMPHIILPSLIHDLRFWYGDGTYGDFAGANDEMAFNGWLVALYDLPFWAVIRKIMVVFAAERCAHLCHKWGWKAYCNAIAEHRDWERNN